MTRYNLDEYIKHTVKLMLEVSGDYYIVEYYDTDYNTIGTYDSMDEAIKNANRVQNRLTQSKELNIQNPEESSVLYIGGVSQNNFFITFITKEYMDNHLDPSKFNDRALYENFKSAGLNYIKTLTTQMGGVNA